MAITQRQIAEQLGISRGLVGMALGGHPRVSEETRQRVQNVALALGYRPNSAARALVTGRTSQIALCFSAESSAFFNELNHRFLLLARDASYELLISSVEASNLVAPSSTDGAIFQGDVPESLVAQGFPAVSLQVDLRGRSAGKVASYDVVQVALEGAARDAVTHLLDEGCRRIAYVTIPNLMGGYEPRYRAYTRVMRENGCAMEKIVVPSSNHRELRDVVRRTLREYFEANGVPDALFCSCDDIAIGAYRALRETGREIPHETAVIGCDDIEEAQDHRPALSSIQWPFNIVCERAWEMLLERIADPSLPPRFEQVKAQFVPRASSQRRSTPAGSTPIAAAELFTQM